MEASIGISQAHLTETAHALNAILADEFFLYLKTRNAHWNVEGPDFLSKHVFFESQYKELEEIVDEVAERIRMLGHYAPATFHEYIALTHLTEQSRENNSSLGFIKTLLADHESVIMKMREKVNQFATAMHDAGTSDFITGLMETHEKMAWILRAHVG